MALAAVGVASVSSKSLSKGSGITNLVLKKTCKSQVSTASSKSLELAIKILVIISVISLYLMTIFVMTSICIPNLMTKIVMMGVIIASGIVAVIALSVFGILQHLMNNRKIQSSMMSNVVVSSEDLSQLLNQESKLLTVSAENFDQEK